MRIEFVEKYLNEASQENMLYEAAVPKDKETYSSLNMMV